MSTNCNTAAELIRQLQHEYGVSKVFGIPGVHTLELYRALNSTTIEHVTPRHEQGAGFMADGYARVSGQPGVCFIISGPGMTNIITAMGQAYSESIPMLVISSMNKHGKMGSGDGALHELQNQQALVNGVCAFSHTVHHPDELTQVLARAFAVFDSQRPRPVHIEIPINILSAPFNARSRRSFAHEGSRESAIASAITARLSPPTGHYIQIQSAAKMLHHAKQIVLLAGGGARRASATITELAESLDAPVVMSVNARGLLPHHHPLAVSSSASLSAARQLIGNADVVLGIGTEMGPTDYDFNEDGQFSIPGVFIRIDIDAQQLMRNQLPQLGIVGDAQSTVLSLISELERISGLERLNDNTSIANDGSTTDNRPIQNSTPHIGTETTATPPEQSGTSRAATTNAQALASLSSLEQTYINTLATIRNTLNDVIIVGDSTQLVYAGNCHFGMNSPSSWFNSAMGFGTLGYALPAAIGAACANPARPVVAISGDGGLQFCLGELATAVDANANLTLIVHENGGYQEISNSMKSQNIAPVGVDLFTPHLSTIATAYGWRCQTLCTLEDLSKVLASSYRDAKAPTLIIIRDELFQRTPA